jgi:hypothetical protein
MKNAPLLAASHERSAVTRGLSPAVGSAVAAGVLAAAAALTPLTSSAQDHGSGLPTLESAQGALPGLPVPVLMDAGPISPEPAPDFQDEGFDTPAAREYAELAARMASAGADFSRVFGAACRHLLDGNPRARQGARAEVGNLFRGLILWTQGGGAPAFQGRQDLALHFLHGGYYSAVYGEALAQTAAYEKERRDAFTPGNSFDLDDYGATLLGARWAARTGRDFEALRRWAAPWASEESRLEALPRLGFGALEHGRLPPPARLDEVKDFVRRAL